MIYVVDKFIEGRDGGTIAFASSDYCEAQAFIAKLEASGDDGGFDGVQLTSCSPEPFERVIRFWCRDSGGRMRFGDPKRETVVVVAERATWCADGRSATYKAGSVTS
ncbi:MAG: hypothetical protein JWM74_3438 [Myxococcaceae bacterium]|nr:hypothetical protein [Myxococcaceae bacterium]